MRKRKWTRASGETKESWLADYRDQAGKRRFKTFARKKDAVAWHAVANVEVSRGGHTPDSVSITVADAEAAWLRAGEAERLERSTLDQRRQHIDIHIVPRLGREKLSRLATPRVEAFRDDLLISGMSAVQAKKVLTSLKALLGHAQRQGSIAQNVSLPVHVKIDKCTARRLEVGVDIPTRGEIRAIVAAAEGRWRPLLITAIFTGLRASELRGLTWENIDLVKQKLHVRQRADRYNDVGAPKSEAGQRTVPLPPIAMNTLKEWRPACPNGPLDLVFPNGAGNVESLANIINRGLMPTLVAASVVTSLGGAKYTGLHTLRDWYASWLINAKRDGGHELPAKVVQERLGHASILMTLDLYGHLFPEPDEVAEMAAAESALLGVHAI